MPMVNNAIMPMVNKVFLCSNLFLAWPSFSFAKKSGGTKVWSSMGAELKNPNGMAFT